MIRAIIASFCVFTTTTAAEWIVAPTGNDDHPGTAAQPCRTLERARDLARAYHQQHRDEPVTISLAEGTYPRSCTLELDHRDSHTTWQAYGTSQPCLSGATPLQRSHCRLTDDPAIVQRLLNSAARTQVWEIDLRAHGITAWDDNRRHGFRIGNDLCGTPPPQWYVGGQRQHLARWPNPDEAFPQHLSPFVAHRRGVVGRQRTQGIVDAGPTITDPAWSARGPTFRYTGDRPQYWTHADDIWLDGVFSSAWEWSYNRILHIDPTLHTITLRHGEVSGLMHCYSGDFFFAENLLEELDQPGEYWVDHTRLKLYFIPPPATWNATSDISVATLASPMLRITAGAHDITIRGLTFSYGRSLALQAQHVHHLTITHCRLRHFAEGGISVDGQENTVSHCDFDGIGGTAIAISGGDPLTLTPGHATVAACTIIHSSWYHRVYHPAIRLAGVGHHVHHCRITDLPHCAIVLYGNDHRIESNDIGDVCHEFDDMGAIYINAGEHPLERGHRIRGNYVHDIGGDRMAHGIYPDNGTMGMTIDHNIFANIHSPTTSARAILINAGAHIITRHNLFLNCSYPLWLSAHSGKANHHHQAEAWRLLFERHPLAQLPHLQHYPELRNFYEEERQFPTTSTFVENAIWNPDIPLGTTAAYRGLDGQPIVMVDGAVAEYPGLTRAGNVLWPERSPTAPMTTDRQTLPPMAAIIAKIPQFPPLSLATIGPEGMSEPTPR